MVALATDNFNRADNPNGLGANWTKMTGENSWAVLSNQANPGNLLADSGNLYTAITWPDNQYSLFTIVTLTGTGAEAGPGPALRMASAARTYYRSVCDGTASPGTNCWIAKFDAGTYTLLASGSASGTWGANDVMRFEVKGTALTLFKNGVNVLSTTDSVILSGSAGIDYSSTLTAVTIDNWEGGDFIFAALMTGPEQRNLTWLRPLIKVVTYGSLLLLACLRWMLP